MTKLRWYHFIKLHPVFKFLCFSTDGLMGVPLLLSLSMFCWVLPRQLHLPWKAYTLPKLQLGAGLLLFVPVALALGNPRCRMTSRCRRQPYPTPAPRIANLLHCRFEFLSYCNYLETLCTTPRAASFTAWLSPTTPTPARSLCKGYSY